MRKLWLLTILLLLAACQSQPSSGPRQLADWQPDAGAQPEAIPESTPWPTQTAAPSIDVAIVEPTPITAEIPTLAPTPVPENMFISGSTGFSMSYPSDWSFFGSDATGFALLDNDFNMFVILDIAFVGDEADSFDVYLEDLLATEFDYDSEDENSLEPIVVYEETVPFGDFSEATIALIESADEEDSESVWTSYVVYDQREYIITVYGETDDIEARQGTLRAMLGHAGFSGPQLFGYDRNTTLVISGFDPGYSSLDPGIQEGSAGSYVGIMYRGLVRLTPQLQIIPDLAETWTVSEDGTVYTFTLRDSGFADGTPITAEDFVYSWERAADPETDSFVARTYLGDIMGVDEMLDGEADSISGIRAIDDKTLEVTLEGPRPVFLAKLTYPTSYVVDEDSVDSEDESWVVEANTPGPYILDEVADGQALIFVRNEHYHTPPAIETLIYTLDFADSDLALFEAGEVDFTGLGLEESQEVRLPSHPQHENWISTTSLCTTFLQVNNSVPPFDDVNVRRAFALAVDKVGLNDLVADGTNVIGDTILPPAMPGYNIDLAAEQNASMFNIEAAQAALAESSYAGQTLPTVRIQTRGFGDSERDDLNFIASTWTDALGVDVTIDYIDSFEFEEIIEDDPGHLLSYGWCADYPDPENFLDILYYTDSDFNISGYSNPDIDAMLEAARIELDPAERLQMYQDIEQAMLDDVAAIPLMHGVSDFVVSKRIEGYVLPPMGAPNIDYMSLLPVEADEGEDQ